MLTDVTNPGDRELADLRVLARCGAVQAQARREARRAQWAHALGVLALAGVNVLMLAGIVYRLADPLAREEALMAINAQSRPPEERRSKILSVNMTPGELQQLEDLATRQGVTRARLAHLLLTQAMRDMLRNNGSR